MKIGYVRVSTVEQNLDRQIEWVKKQGAEKIYSEKMSGKNKERPQFKEMMDFVREGDVLYVESFSRLSRSTQDLLETVQILNEKGVKIISQKENVDTTTPQGNLVMTIFAALSEFEREITLERQREGIAIAKAKGKYMGRKAKPVTDDFREAVKMWSEGSLRLKEAIKRSGVSEATFFRYCRKAGIKKEVA